MSLQVVPDIVVPDEVNAAGTVSVLLIRDEYDGEVADFDEDFLLYAQQRATSILVKKGGRYFKVLRIFWTSPILEPFRNLSIQHGRLVCPPVMLAAGAFGLCLLHCALYADVEEFQTFCLRAPAGLTGEELVHLIILALDLEHTVIGRDEFEKFVRYMLRRQKSIIIEDLWKLVPQHLRRGRGRPRHDQSAPKFLQCENYEALLQRAGKMEIKSNT